jgi:hypothetical protein
MSCCPRLKLFYMVVFFSLLVVYLFHCHLCLCEEVLRAEFKGGKHTFKSWHINA